MVELFEQQLKNEDRHSTKEIQYKNNIFHGVKSMDLLETGWQIITLERLFKNLNGQSLSVSIWKISDVKERLRFLVNQVERYTGIRNFGIYLAKLFTLDAFFLNEDRHMHIYLNKHNSYSKYCKQGSHDFFHVEFFFLIKYSHRN